MIQRLNELIMIEASKINYTVSDHAPDTFNDLIENSQGTLTVWAGASDNTIYGDPTVNHAFRAWHDHIHLRYGLGFTIPEEIEVAKIQASILPDRLGDIILAEVAGQANYLKEHGHFPEDQKAFINQYLTDLWGFKVSI